MKSMAPWRMYLTMCGCLLLAVPWLNVGLEEFWFPRYPIHSHIDGYLRLGLIAQGAAMLAVLFGLCGKGWPRIILVALGIWEAWHFRYLTVFG